MLLVFLPFCSGAFGQSNRHNAVVVSGNKDIPTHEILAWFNPDTIHVWDERAIHSVATMVCEGYARVGYPFARVDTIVQRVNASGEPEVFIALQEGQRAIIRSIQITGSHLASVNNAAVEKGTSFTRSSLESIIERILSEHEEAGYPFAEVTIRDIRFTPTEDEALADVLLEVRPGTRLVVRHVKVQGNSTTREGIIAREVGIADGVSFSPELLTKVQRRVERLRLFSKVYPPELFIDNDEQGGILIKVEEGKQNQFDGVVGYVPGRRQNERGTVMGLVDVQFRNLFGTARRFSIRWQREDRLSQEVGLRYFEPWVVSLPIDAEIGFQQRRQDSSFVRQSVEVRTETRITDAFSAGLSFSTMNVYPGERQIVVRRSNLVAYGGVLRYDSRDNLMTPENGVLYATEVQTGRKDVEGMPAERTRKVMLDLEHYFSPFRRQVLAVLVHAREFRSASVQTSDLFRLGGTSTLRGYRENQFLGSRMAWMNVEYRFLTGGRSFAYAFLDAAYVSLAGVIGAGGDQRKIGYGLGIRLDTGIGLIGVSVALGEGDTFSTAKLHFRLVNEF